MAGNNTGSNMNPQVRITHESEDGSVKAFCSVTLYGTIAIRGIRVVEGKNGLFVSMPGSWNRKNEYMDTVFPVTKQAHEELYEAVMQAYKQHLEQNNSGPKMQM